MPTQVVAFPLVLKEFSEPKRRPGGCVGATFDVEKQPYITTIPTEHRIFTLKHDPQYRVAIAWKNVAYNQPPHPSFYRAMKRPKITLTKGSTPESAPGVKTGAENQKEEK